MNILGIETSCDETSIAIISDNKLKSNLISSQDFHSKYGGVVPELSSRAHIQRIVPLIKDSLNESNLSVSQIDAIAVTAGPGLIGALLVGFIFGKTLAYSLNKIFVPVNHIEGHIFSGFLPADKTISLLDDTKEKPKFPILVLVVSGGHTMLVLVESFTRIRKLGSTVDDAAGEAFDKVSKMLGLGYPGGPQIQMHAKKGNPDLINFPIADLKNKYDFSFSGLKTAVLRYIQKNYEDVSKIKDDELNNITAAFQKSVVKALIKNSELALNNFEVNSISLVGGVAANEDLRSSFFELGKKYNKKVFVPKFEFCGDNAAMIAFRGLTLINEGEKFSFDYEPFPNFFSKYFIQSRYVGENIIS
ncbi:MAG: tRNA (adenosine(37)-N6)-threonylcarbamoyltransferase complex transferase subunit TsaD [Ignavibacterium sp.]